jgi:hypothetical protein
MYNNPTYEKQDYVQASPMVSAQPVVGNTYASPPTGVQAQPYNSQPVYVHSNGQPIVNGPQGAYPVAQRQRPINRWADNICDWPTNLYPSCYCTLCACCGIWLVSQMAQKTGCSTFRNVFIGWIACCIFGFILAVITGGGGFVYYIPMIYMFITAIVLRVHLARRDNITEHGGCFGECCVGFWCWSCSVAQMARHLYGYQKVLDGDGDPDRPDQWAPPMQV